jgi:hypothetical protein
MLKKTTQYLLLITILSIITINIVSAEISPFSIFNVIEDIKNTPNNYIMTIGNQANANDIILAANTAAFLKITNSNIEDEITTLDQQLVVVGNPSTNSLIEQILGTWTYSETQIVIAISNQEHPKLIIGALNSNLLNLALPYIKEYLNYPTEFANTIYIIETATPQSTTTGGGGGGGGGGRSSSRREECISDWQCKSWSHCKNGIRSRICINQGDCEGEKPITIQKCLDKQPIEEKPSQPIIQLKEESFVEQIDNTIYVKINLENQNKEELKFTHIEINFNQKKSTKFADLIDRIKIPSEGTRYITRTISSKKLKPGVHDVVLKIYHKGKIIEERTQQLEII